MRPIPSHEQEQKPVGGNRHRFRHRHGDVVPITKLKPGEQGTIAFVQGESKVTQRLADLGLIPETSISVLGIAPFNGPIEVAVRGARLAIGRDIAEKILVQAK